MTCLCRRSLIVYIDSEMSQVARDLPLNRCSFPKAADLSCYVCWTWLCALLLRLMMLHCRADRCWEEGGIWETLYQRILPCLKSLFCLNIWFTQYQTSQQCLHASSSIIVLWLSPIRVCSPTSHQQPPWWSVLGQIYCFSPWQPVKVVFFSDIWILQPMLASKLGLIAEAWNDCCYQWLGQNCLLTDTNSQIVRHVRSYFKEVT